MKAALAGLGMVARAYGDAFRNSRAVDLALVHARSPESRRAFLDAWPGLGAGEVETPGDLAGSDVDFVVVATPPNARAELVEALARAGKPILMEKPVERTLDAATRLVEACEAASVPLGIVLQHRARPAVAELRREMPSLGPLAAVEIGVPWWRPQGYYDEPGRGTYARDGGGVLISQAIHALDLALWLAGPVAEVAAMTATTAFHRMESEDFVSAGLRFANGAAGQLFATTASYPGRSESIALHFEKGSARLEAGTLRIDRRDGTAGTFGEDAGSGGGADPMAFTSDWHRRVIEDFAEAVATGRDPLATGRSALEAHRLIAAIEESGRTGATVRVGDAR